MALSRHRRALLGGLALVLVPGLSGCGGDPVPIGPQGVDGLTVPTPSPDPVDFVEEVDNPYLPLVPGSRWVYEVSGQEGGTTTVTTTVTVTEETREVAGVSTTVVRDQVTDPDGRVVEETLRWFAQDVDGNVWSFGEQTTAYDGRAGAADAATTGSWEAGVDGAQAGLAMPAEPRVGDGYRHELAEGRAEDQAQVLALGERRDVGGTTYGDLLVTEETTPLQPGLVEQKYYAPGLGLVLVETVSGGEERVELVDSRLVASGA